MFLARRPKLNLAHRSFISLLIFSPTRQMADSLHLQPLCIDSGTLTTRVGFAGGTAPKHSFSSSSGSVKHSRVMAGGALENEPDNVVGEHVQAHPGAYKLTPAQSYNGQINSYSTLKDLHRHAFEVMGLQETAASHPVLLAENVAATNQQPTRNSLAQFLFEEMQSPCLFFAPSGVLSLYAAGCTTGVVLNVGEGASQCSPIYEGLGLSHSLSSTGVAGRRVTKIMQNRLRAEAGLHFTTTAEFQIVRKMKEVRRCDKSRKHGEERPVKSAREQRPANNAFRVDCAAQLAHCSCPPPLTLASVFSCRPLGAFELMTTRFPTPRTSFPTAPPSTYRGWSGPILSRCCSTPASWPVWRSLASCSS